MRPRLAFPAFAPHDLRRSCAKMCRAAGGELEQIQLLLGPASDQTTERYLGTKRISIRLRRNKYVLFRLRRLSRQPYGGRADDAGGEQPAGYLTICKTTSRRSAAEVAF